MPSGNGLHVLISLVLSPLLLSENVDVRISMKQDAIQLNWHTLFDKHPLNGKDSLLQIVSPAEHKVYQAHVAEKDLRANFTSGSSFQAYLLYSKYKKIRKAHLFHSQVWTPTLGKFKRIIKLNSTLTT